MNASAGGSPSAWNPRRIAGFGIQLLASVALMGLLLSRIGFGEVAGRLELHRPALAGAGLLLLTMQLIVGTQRWRLICAALDVAVPRPRLALGWVGASHALSQVLPSLVGGDAYRIVALGRLSGVGAAARTVVADRVAGLLTLAVIALPLSLAAVPLAPAPVAFFAYAALSGAVLAGVIVAGVAARALARWTASRLVAVVAADFAALYAKSTLSAVFSASVAIHVLALGAIACFAGALALDEVRWWQAALVAPGTLLASAIPVSLGGWGVRESGMVFGLSAFGVSHAAALALSIAYGLAMIVTAAIGVLVWVANAHVRTAGR